MLRETFIFLSENRLARRISTRTPGTRAIARRFVAGETLDEGLSAARRLVAEGFHVTLDYLGESVGTREEASAAADVYVELVRRIAAEPALHAKANVSIKLTQMGQDVRTGNGRVTAAHAPPARWPRPTKGMTPENHGDWDDAFLHDNVGRILDAAKEHDVFVRFDMEGTPHTQRTLDFFRSLWDEGHNHTGIVLQSYLYRTEHDAREANLLGARVRLCKGAYMEPADYAFQDKRDVDVNYVRVMKLLLSDGNYPGIATHDEAMIRATRDYAREKSIPNSAFEFQMLHGIRRDLQRQLVHDGCNLRVYLPFGDAWYPYLMRRMAERPANVAFIVNSVLRESPLGFMFGGRHS
jgi:proline dehydrogenase